MDLPLYFLHIPRTAGTSVTEVIDRRFRPDEVFPGQLLPSLIGLPVVELARYRLFRGHFGTVLPNILDWRARIFTLVRHPVAHVLSVLRYVRQYPWHPLHEQPSWHGGTPSAQLRDPLFVELFANFQARGLIADPAPTAQVWRAAPRSTHPDEWRAFFASPAGGRLGSAWGPNASLVTGDDAELLTRATAVLARIEVVGVTERSTETMAILHRAMGWAPPDALPVRNAAPTSVDSSSLDASDVAFIRERFAVDFELYALALTRLDEALAAARDQPSPSP